PKLLLSRGKRLCCRRHRRGRYHAHPLSPLSAIERCPSYFAEGWHRSENVARLLGGKRMMLLTLDKPIGIPNSRTNIIDGNRAVAGVAGYSVLSQDATVITSFQLSGHFSETALVGGRASRFRLLFESAAFRLHSS